MFCVVPRPRAPLSCPIVLNMPVCLRLWLSPLACALGRRAPLSGCTHARCVRYASALSPLRSVRLRPPLCSVRPRSLELQHYKSGATGVRCVRYRGFAPQRRSPSLALRPACEPFGLFDCIRSLACACSAGGCVWRVCRAGYLAGCRSALRA